MQEKAEELVKTAGQTIVEAVETDKKTKEKNAIETSIRNHLRGFSRTIPSFLMAYGNNDTTLENFDKIIPDEVFKDVTSISLGDFRFLRDVVTILTKKQEKRSILTDICLTLWFLMIRSKSSYD